MQQVQSETYEMIQHVIINDRDTQHLTVFNESAFGLYLLNVRAYCNYWIAYWLHKLTIHTDQAFWLYVLILPTLSRLIQLMSGDSDLTSVGPGNPLWDGTVNLKHSACIHARDL